MLNHEMSKGQALDEKNHSLMVFIQIIFQKYPYVFSEMFLPYSIVLTIYFCVLIVLIIIYELPIFFSFEKRFSLVKITHSRFLYVLNIGSIKVILLSYIII